MKAKQFPSTDIRESVGYVCQWACMNGDMAVSHRYPYDGFVPSQIVFSDGSVMTAEYNRWDEDLKVHWWSVRWVDRNGTVIVHRVGYDPIEPVIEDDDYVQTKTTRRLDGWVKDLSLSDDGCGYKLKLIDVDNNVIGHFEGSDWRDDFELM